MKKRTLALTLAFCLLAGLMGTMALAEETALAAPAGIEIKIDTPLGGADPLPDLTLTWNAVAGAEHYHIYRTNMGYNDYQQIGIAEGTEFVDDTTALDTVYQYKLTACVGGVESDFSAVCYGQTPMPNATLVAALDLRAAGGGCRLRIGDATGDGRPDILMVQPDFQKSSTVPGGNTSGWDDAYEPHQVGCLTLFDLEGNLIWQRAVNYGAAAVNGTAPGELYPNGSPDAKPLPDVSGSGADEPAQIVDIDGDGQNEVVAIMGKMTRGHKICIFDGATGELKYPAIDLTQVITNSPTSRSGRDTFVAHDCFGIGNFFGEPGDAPRDLFVKDRYSNMWVLQYNEDFTALTMKWQWSNNRAFFNLHFRTGKYIETETAEDALLPTTWSLSGNPSWGSTGHMPMVADLNEDGLDEILMGYCLFRGDGTLEWAFVNGTDHCDTLIAGDINGDGVVEIVEGGAQTYALKLEGKGPATSGQNIYGNVAELIWENRQQTEPQSLSVGDLRPDVPGLEVFGLDRVNRGTYRFPANGRVNTVGWDSLFFINSLGQTMYKEDPAELEKEGFLTITYPVYNYNGHYTSFMLACNRGWIHHEEVVPSIYDGFFNQVEKFEVDGRFWVLDVCGDNKEEVILYGDKKANGAAVTVADAAAYGGTVAPTQSQIRIYTHDTAAAADKLAYLRTQVTGTPKPQPRPDVYNFSRYPDMYFKDNMTRRAPSSMEKVGTTGFKWAAVFGAESYNIYRENAGVYELIGTSDIPEYTATLPAATGTYNYKVSAVDHDSESGLSAAVSLYVAEGKAIGGGLRSVKKGKTLQLEIDITPAAAVSDITWLSLTPTIASVENGLVKGLKAGTAMIVAKLPNGKTLTYTVMITN